MKYTEDQKRKVIRQGLNLRREHEIRRTKLQIEFPVAVHIEKGYLVIESKMNQP